MIWKAGRVVAMAPAFETVSLSKDKRNRNTGDSGGKVEVCPDKVSITGGNSVKLAALTRVQTIVMVKPGAKPGSDLRNEPGGPVPN